MSEQELGGLENSDENRVEAARQMLLALDAAWKSARVAPYEKSKDNIDHHYQTAVDCLPKILDDRGKIKISVKPVEMFLLEKSVYANKVPRQSMSHYFYEGGIRSLDFRKGLTKAELVEVVRLLATDLYAPEMMDQDLYSLFAENVFDHFDVTSEDLLAEAVKKDPELKGKLKDFYLKALQPHKPKKEASPRKLRDQDLATLQDFKVPQSLFENPPEAISHVAKVMVRTRAEKQNERERLERLLRMGYHFLLGTERDADRIRVGKDIVSHAAVMMLELGEIDQFLSILNRIQELKKEQADLSQDFDEIRELVFDTRFLSAYQTMLFGDEVKTKVVSLLKDAPPNASKLIILLFGKHPWLSAQLGNSWVEGVFTQEDWLKDLAAKDPQNLAFGPILNGLSKMDSVKFRSFVAQLLVVPQWKFRVRIRGELAAIASQEALRILLESLESNMDETERAQTYEAIANHLLKNKTSVRMFVVHLQNEIFKTYPFHAKVAAYAALARIAGEVSWPFFEKQWTDTLQKSLFRATAKVETQRAILFGLQKTLPTFITRLAEITPMKDLDTEVESFLLRFKKKEGAS